MLLPVGNSGAGEMGNLPPERPLISNFCAVSVKGKKQEPCIPSSGDVRAWTDPTQTKKSIALLTI